MGTVLFQNVRGTPMGEPRLIKGNLRRLSSIVKRFTDETRPFIVSVVRRNDGVELNDATVRLRREWAKTIVGKADVVLVTYLPRGKTVGGGGKMGKQIGMAVAAIALAVAMPYAVGAIGGVLTTATGALSVTGKIVAAALTAGIPLCAYTLIQRARAAVRATA